MQEFKPVDDQAAHIMCLEEHHDRLSNAAIAVRLLDSMQGNQGTSCHGAEHLEVKTRNGNEQQMSAQPPRPNSKRARMTFGTPAHEMPSGMSRTPSQACLAVRHQQNNTRIEQQKTHPILS